MGKGIAIGMSLIVFLSFLLPWFHMTPAGSGDNRTLSAGYPELYSTVQGYIISNVSHTLTKNVNQSQLYNEDGSMKPLGRVYSAIADFAGALVSLVMLGAIAGLFGRKGHALGLLGMLVFTWGIYGLANAYSMTVSPQPAYFVAFLAFLVGVIAGGSTPKKGKGRGK